MPTSPEGSSSSARASGPHITQRGLVAVSVVMAALLVVCTVVGVHELRGPSDRAAAKPSTPSPSASATGVGASASTAASGSATPSATRSATSSPSLPAGATVDSEGYVHSNLPASGRFANSTVAIAPRKRTSVLHTYIVQVETSLSSADADLAPNVVAAEVASVLNDPRGWIGMTSGLAKGVSFQLVTDPSKAEFVVHLASAQTVNKLCPLDTANLWSCDAGKTVLLNADRWLYRTPVYPDTTQYRAYLVNHEVGHFLGFGHKQCPGAGKPAPVMMQQSKGLGSCTANAWPTVA